MDQFMRDLALLDDEDLYSQAVVNCFDGNNNGISNLQNSKHYMDVMHAIEFARTKPDDLSSQVMVDALELLDKIDEEIVKEYNYIRDRYRVKFPELESLVRSPVEYARIVKMIGNETDLTQLPCLREVLTSNMVMVLSLTASTTSGKPLPLDVLEETLGGCDRVIEFDTTKAMILDFVESRASDIAPSLSVLVGSNVAAKLVAAAGGLEKLAYMPSCNIQVLGARKNSLAGFSSGGEVRVGYIDQSEVFQSAPDSIRHKVARVLAAKLALAARVDFAGGDYSTGQAEGRKLLEEVRKKIAKLQEPTPARVQESLPVPNDSSSKKKRGGKRLRKRNERYEETYTRKLANRVKFNVPEESSLGDGLGVGYGMLGQDGCGRLRGVFAGSSNKLIRLSKRHQVRNQQGVGVDFGCSTVCFAFTPVQGIELPNQQPDADQLGRGTQSTYFSQTAAFSNVNRV